MNVEGEYALNLRMLATMSSATVPEPMISEKEDDRLNNARPFDFTGR